MFVSSMMNLATVIGCAYPVNPATLPVERSRPLQIPASSSTLPSDVRQAPLPALKSPDSSIR